MSMRCLSVCCHSETCATHGMMSDADPSTLARFVAAHAVAEARLGHPYEWVDLDVRPHWSEPERPLAWRTASEAAQLLLRLSVGFVATERAKAGAEAFRIAARELEGVADIIEATDGQRPAHEEAAEHARRAAGPFLDDAANSRAIDIATAQMLVLRRLSLQEVDFILDAADGDPDALDDLERFRAAFAPTRIPWPDHT